MVSQVEVGAIELSRKLSVGLLSLLTVMLTTIFIDSCSSSGSSEDEAADLQTLQHALQHYSDLVLHMDNDSIATLFTEEAELKNPGEPEIRGREAIRKFLGSFTEYRVLEEFMKADSTTVSGTRAVQFAGYRQKVVVPNGKIVEASGRVRIEWTKESGKWLIADIEDLPRNK